MKRSDDLVVDPSASIQPILIPTKFHTSVDDNAASVGVVLPWRPQEIQPDRQAVGQDKYYFTATGGQTVITGVDLQGNTLNYQPGPNTDVFINGLNQSELTAYTAVDGIEITMSAPLNLDDNIEIWTPDQPLELIAQSTVLKLDNIEGLFDGVTTEFPLTYGGGTPISLQVTTNLMIWMDTNPQEAFTDYDTLADPGNPTTDSLLKFTEAPEVGDRFWGIVFAPVSAQEEFVKTTFAGGLNIEIVSALPGSPDPNVLYFIT